MASQTLFFLCKLCYNWSAGSGFGKSATVCQEPEQCANLNLATLNLNHNNTHSLHLKQLAGSSSTLLNTQQYVRTNVGHHGAIQVEMKWVTWKELASALKFERKMNIT